MLKNKNSIGGELNVLGAKRAQRTATVIRLVITYLFLAIMAVIVIFPFYWMIISSLKTMDEYRENVPTLWPREIVWENFLTAFDKANLKDLFLNTLFVGVVSTALSLIVTVLSAFAFARLQFKGKNLVFGLLMATMMVPGELYTITNYLTCRATAVHKRAVGWLDMTNTFAVLIFPMLVSVFTSICSVRRSCRYRTSCTSPRKSTARATSISVEGHAPLSVSS
jgi:multiple sugar transport system permease protein